ncbi:unnamed protein product [Camellia sinensis]
MSMARKAKRKACRAANNAGFNEAEQSYKKQKSFFPRGKLAMASSQGMQLQLQPIILVLVQVQVVVVVILSLSAATIAAPPTEADLKNVDCMSRCGNLNIPYPFGVKENCYRSEDFFINCSDSQPYLWHSDITISNISLEEGELRIMNYISRNCYDRLGTPLQSNFYGWLVASNFSISSTKNKFTSIGCDTYGFLHTSPTFLMMDLALELVAARPQSQNDSAISKLMCIASTIIRILDFNPCSYAFVVEEAAFNFSTTYLQDFKETKVPLVLDWGIGDNKTCDEAKRNLTSYACGDNSDCYEAEIRQKSVMGISASVPRVTKGTHTSQMVAKVNIDECADPNLNQCVGESKCLNTPGNYTCSCPKRYHGDGKTDGTRCTAAGPDLVLLIVIDLISGIG